MKKRIILVVAILLILSGIFLLVKIAATTLAPQGRGALQITSNVKATVFLDDKSVGATPVCLCEQNQIIPSGIHQLKVVPDDSSLSIYNAKVDINPGVLTAVERTFLPGSLASSYILTLEKTTSADPEILIVSIPDGALVSVDGESESVTPYKQTLSASEHEIEIDKPGFAKKTIRVRAVKSYRLVLDVAMGVEGQDQTANPAPTQAPDNLTTPTPSVAPKTVIKILTTPTGFLRVRASASVSAAEIGRVNPGETYDYVDENDSWFEIKLTNGTDGWISKSYADKVTQ